MSLANREAEAGIICAVLFSSPTDQDQLLKALTPRDFHTPTHEDIWATLKAMRAEGRVIDGITVMSGLAKHGHQNHQAPPHHHTFLIHLIFLYFFQIIRLKAKISWVSCVVHRQNI